MEEQDIRREMGEILDLLSATSRRSIAERSTLLVRQLELRAALQDVEMPGSDEIRKRWSEQAASKPAADTGEPFIPSHTEGGGSVS